VLVEECLRTRDGVPSGQHILEYGEDDLSIALAHAVWLQTILGHPHSARAYAARLREHAEGLNHPFVRMSGRALLALSGLVGRDLRAAFNEAEAALALGHEHSLAPLMMASLVLHRGWVLALQGQADGMLPAMRQALAGIEAAGVRLWYAFSRLQLGEARLCAERLDEASRLVEAATAVASELGLGGWMCECLRLGGEVLLEQSALPAASGHRRPRRRSWRRSRWPASSGPGSWNCARRLTWSDLLRQEERGARGARAGRAVRLVQRRIRPRRSRAGEAGPGQGST